VAAQIARRLTAGYAFALGLLFLFSLFAYLVADNLTDAIERDWRHAEMVDRSETTARGVMYLAVHRLDPAGPPGAHPGPDRLATHLAELEALQDSLVSQEDALPDGVARVLFEDPHRLDAHVRAFIAETRRLLEAGPSESASGAILDLRPDLLAGYQAARDALVVDLAGRGKLLRRLELGLMVLVGLVALGLGLFVLRPITRRAEEQFEERRAMADDLRRQSELLETAINATDHGLCLVDRNRDILAVNRSFLALHGVGSTEPLEGAPLSRLIRLAAERGELGPGRPEVVARTQLTLLTSGLDVVLERERPSGRVVEVRCRTISTEDGAASTRAGAHVISCADVSDRKHVEGLLRHTDQLFRSVFDAAPIGLAVLDPEGSVIRANPNFRRMYGLEGVGALETYNLFSDSSVDDDTRLRLRSGDTVRAGRWVDFRRMQRDGVQTRGARERYLECVYVPFRERGRRDGYLTIVEDQTSRQEAEEERAHLQSQLLQAQKMEAIGQLTGGIAHDFNNILGIVLGNLDLLQERHSGDPTSAEFLGPAIKAVLRGSDLTHQLLAFSRRQTLLPEVVEVNRQVTEVERLLRNTLGPRVSVAVELAEKAWRVKVDVGQLQSGLINLALNARDAMPDGGTVLFRTQNLDLEGDALDDLRPGAYVRIDVIDQGTGMAPDVAARAFEPFFTTKEPGRGSGLGLSMIYGFMKQSGGHVALESDQGRGTTVTLYLPRTLESPRPDPDHDRPEGGRRGGRILVVEDDPGVRNLVAAILADEGYDVIAVDGDVAALAVIDRNPDVELLFTDVVLPGSMNGFELAREIRRRRPGIAVLYTSGYAPSGTDGEATPGTAPVLRKPYRKADLAAAVRRALEEARRADVTAREEASP